MGRTMRSLLRTVLVLLGVVIDYAVGTCSTFETQVNVSMCNWQGLSANILRDTIYLNGGQLWYQQGYSDGCVLPIPDNGLQGTTYYLNLSTSFNTSSDFMNVLNNMSVTGSAISNIAPNYVDGTMFANDDMFYLYGGMLRNSASTQSPPDNEVLSYSAYQYGAYKTLWEPGWNHEYLPTNVTRYITNGAGASAPSENLGFYFSGMRASHWGDFTLDGMESNITADTLITVDMSVMNDGKWANNTLPSYIPGRANAELVWVPVSESGVLVAIGGVIDPIEFYRNDKSNSSRTAESKKVSPTFMETVAVFDVASETDWYLQNTTGDIPPQLTEFCSVIASATDGSSHNIYIYGGYNGLDNTANPSDDVYILSLPSFKWVKAYNGTVRHGRSGHRCIKVYPDQMFTVGGQHVDPSQCLEGGVIVNFNLNSLSFQDNYDPAHWSEYKVPDLVTAQIGGNSNGGATTTAPSSWTNASLAGIFDKKYAKTVETYWPYNSTSSSTQHHKSGSGFPGWAGAIIGVVLGLFVIALLVGFWFYRRRRRQSAEAEAEAAKEAGNKKRPEWMYAGGPTSPGPGPSSTGMETTMTEATQPSTVQDSLVSSASPGTVESGGSVVYEMHDSSPVELPTQFNVSYLAPNMAPQLSPRRGSPSPVSLQAPGESDSEHSYPAGHIRRPSSASIGPSLSIDDVMTDQTSPFHESYKDVDMRRARHESEVSEVSVCSGERGHKGGNETIHEDE